MQTLVKLCLKTLAWHISLLNNLEDVPSEFRERIINHATKQITSNCSNVRNIAIIGKIFPMFNPKVPILLGNLPYFLDYLLFKFLYCNTIHHQYSHINLLLIYFSKVIRVAHPFFITFHCIMIYPSIRKSDNASSPYKILPELPSFQPLFSQFYQWLMVYIFSADVP